MLNCKHPREDEFNNYCVLFVTSEGQLQYLFIKNSLLKIHSTLKKQLNGISLITNSTEDEQTQKQSVRDCLITNIHNVLSFLDTLFCILLKFAAIIILLFLITVLILDAKDLNSHPKSLIRVKC